MKYSLLLPLIVATTISHGFLQQQCPRRRNNKSSNTNKMSILSEVSTAYTNSLIHNKLMTESITAALLAGLGDFGAQVQEEGKTTIDIRRCGSFVLKGSVSGILWSKWYAFCDPLSMSIVEHIDFAIVNKDILRVLTSIVLEQILMCPLLFALWEIPVPLLLRGDPINSIPQQVKNKFGGLLVENAKVWSFANLIIYNVPLQWRVVVVSFTDLFWQSIVSSTLMAAEEEPQSIQEQLNSQLSLSIVEEQTVEEQVLEKEEGELQDGAVGVSSTLK